MKRYLVRFILGDGPVNIISNVDDDKQLCERGGQTIELSLTVKCLKRGKRIY